VSGGILLQWHLEAFPWCRFPFPQNFWPFDVGYSTGWAKLIFSLVMATFYHGTTGKKMFLGISLAVFVVVVVCSFVCLFITRYKWYILYISGSAVTFLLPAFSLYHPCNIGTILETSPEIAGERGALQQARNMWWVPWHGHHHCPDGTSSDIEVICCLCSCLWWPYRRYNLGRKSSSLNFSLFSLFLGCSDSGKRVLFLSSSGLRKMQSSPSLGCAPQLTRMGTLAQVMNLSYCTFSS